jgi:protein phosphatase
LTRDQTLAQGLVDEGVMSPDSAERSPLSHVLSSAVGKEITPASESVEVETGDVLMLCTDGLTKHVSEERIREYLAVGEPSEDTCRTLMAAALDGGGTDNVNVVVCRYI